MKKVASESFCYHNKNFTCLRKWFQVIYKKRLCMTVFPNTEKKAENTMCSAVFLTNFKVFGNVVKHGLECLIYLLSRNYN